MELEILNYAPGNFNMSLRSSVKRRAEYKIFPPSSEASRQVFLTTLLCLIFLFQCHGTAADEIGPPQSGEPLHQGQQFQQPRSMSQGIGLPTATSPRVLPSPSETVDAASARDILKVAHVVVNVTGLIFASITLVLAVAAFFGFKELQKLRRLRHEMQEAVKSVRHEQGRLQEQAETMKNKFSSLVEKLEKDARTGLEAVNVFNRAENSYGVGQYEMAVHLYERLGDMKPSDPLPLVKMGRALTYLERYTEAEQRLKRALEIDGRSGQAYYALAIIKRFTNLDEAIELCQRALDLDNGEASFHTYLGILLTQKGDFENAIKHHEAAYEISSSGDTCFCLSLLKKKTGDDDRAQYYMIETKEIAQKNLEVGRRQIWSHFYLWYCHAAKNEIAESLEQLGRLKVLSISVRLERVMGEQIRFFCDAWDQQDNEHKYLERLSEVAGPPVQ